MCTWTVKTESDRGAVLISCSVVVYDSIIYTMTVQLSVAVAILALLVSAAGIYSHLTVTRDVCSIMLLLYLL